MCRGGPGGGKPSSPGAACSTVAMALRGSCFLFSAPPRKARDTHTFTSRSPRPQLYCKRPLGLGGWRALLGSSYQTINTPSARQMTPKSTYLVSLVHKQVARRRAVCTGTVTGVTQTQKRMVCKRDGETIPQERHTGTQTSRQQSNPLRRERVSSFGRGTRLNAARGTCLSMQRLTLVPCLSCESCVCESLLL